MLLGRDREQRALVSLLDDARGGRSGVLAVVGEPGIGKSALLDYALEQARDMNVLRARGVQSEAQIPFCGLLELIRPALNCIDKIPAPQAAALSGALALRPAQRQDRFAVGAATLSLLAEYAESGPVAVLVDDAHWLDESSADAMLFAFRRLFADPVAVVMAARKDEPSLLDGADLPTLELPGLDRMAATELLRSHGNAQLRDEIAERLHRETGGNSLALVELGRETERLADLPPGAPLAAGTSVARAYLQRLSSLPPQTRDFLMLAAALDGGDLSVLARAAPGLGLDLPDLIPAEAAALVMVTESRVEFTHPLARSAIYGAAAPDRLREIHRALAGVLPDAEADRRAWHLALASFGPDEPAASALEQAGQRAMERSAYEVASRTFERAARLSPDEARQGRLLHAAADAAWLGALANRAVALLDQAAKHALTPDLEISVAHLRGHIAIRRGPVAEAQKILLAAAERAAPTDPERAVELLAEVVDASLYLGDAVTMRTAATRAASLATPEANARTTFFASFARGIALIISGESEPGAPAIREAVGVLDGSAELGDDSRLLAWVVTAPLFLREAEIGSALASRALSQARARSAIGILPLLLSRAAVGQVATDRWAQAHASFHEAISLARETGQVSDLSGALSRLALLEARQGRAEQARAHAQEGLRLARERGLRLFELWALAALGELEMSLRDAGAAVAHFEEQDAVLRAYGIGDADLSPAPELVEVYLRMSRGEDAALAAQAFSRTAEAKAQPWSLGRAARCRALLAADADFDDEFQAALSLHTQAGDAFELGRTHLAYGARLRRERQRVRAREQLRAAVDVFDRLGADPWSDIARAELAATGETVRRRGVTTLNDLTPQELQIALSLAEGRTTRETAAALFLSPKTIEYHLRNVYRKLSINSRAELKEAMGQLLTGPLNADRGDASAPLSSQRTPEPPIAPT